MTPQEDINTLRLIIEGWGLAGNFLPVPKRAKHGESVAAAEKALERIAYAIKCQVEPGAENDKENPGDIAAT